MGCRSRKGAGCYSFTCCCCVEGEEACWWIGAVSGAWCAVATLVDFISAYLPQQYCHACLDHSLQSKLSLVAGSINIGQCLTSVLLLHGARKESKRVLVPWLLWCVASLVMMVVWVVVTAPHMPSLRGILSLFQLAWGIHFFLVVRTQYSRLALKLAPPEAAPLTVPPNTPARRHRRWRRRLDPGCQPPIRTLLGAALRLHRDEEDEDKPIRVVVSGNGSVDGGGEEDQTCYRRRGRRTLPPEGGRPEGRPDARHILLHTADREARRTVERRTRHSHHDHHDCSADEDAGRCEAITGDHGEAVPVLFWIPKRPPLTPMDPIPTTPLTHTPSPPNPTNTPPPTSPTIPSKSSHRD